MPRAIRTLVADAEKTLGTSGASTLAQQVRSRAARLRTSRLHPTPLDLAAAHDLTIVRTPALELVNQQLWEAANSRDGRLVVSLPPQEGKSTLLRWLCARLLVEDPNRRIVFASYQSELARTSGRMVRGMVRAHGEQWGMNVSLDHANAADWQLSDHRGGLFSTGVGGALTGRPADGLVIDDPIKGQAEADSPTVLGRLHDWWESVARTRLAPGAWVVVVQTRWVEDDLAGRMAGRGWPLLNIPAFADGKTPDALNRPVGEYLQSARGRSPDEWLAIRRDVGERVWAALYQGVPAPPAGGIFLAEWFDRDRVTGRPDNCLPPVVVVDPADNTGDGDEAGVLVASADTNQHIYLGPDLSACMTTGRWVRVALLALVEHGATAVAYEQSLSGLNRSIRDGWRALWKQARALRRKHPRVWPDTPEEGSVDAVTAELTHPDDPDETRQRVRSELVELWPLVDRVLGYPDTGPTVRRITAKGTKQWRAQLAAPLYEHRRVHHVGKLAELEHQQLTWQPGQDSPDRMDTAVYACLLLSGATTATLTRPESDREVPTRSTRLRRRTGLITRTTRR